MQFNSTIQHLSCHDVDRPGEFLQRGLKGVLDLLEKLSFGFETLSTQKLPFSSQTLQFQFRLLQNSCKIQRNTSARPEHFTCMFVQVCSAVSPDCSNICRSEWTCRWQVKWRHVSPYLFFLKVEHSYLRPLQCVFTSSNKLLHLQSICSKKVPRTQKCSFCFDEVISSAALFNVEANLKLTSNRTNEFWCVEIEVVQCVPGSIAWKLEEYRWRSVCSAIHVIVNQSWSKRNNEKATGTVTILSSTCVWFISSGCSCCLDGL